MSAEIPVCDVLLEAADYLCKLGANLKVRSASLKERRITRDKLKNTHAVQKTADKLLLICELSKKSLCNVENGVKKILTACGLNTYDQTLASTSSWKQNEPKTPSHYIDYRSRRLRIKQKVNFKHYASVKVVAKKISLDKYPVYYDCKLYQIRKKKLADKLSKERQLDSDDNSSRDTKSDISLNKKDDKFSPTKKKRVCFGSLDTSSGNSDNGCEKEEKNRSSSGKSSKTKKIQSDDLSDTEAKKPDSEDKKVGTNTLELDNKDIAESKNTKSDSDSEENFTKTALKKKKKVCIGSLDSSPEDTNDDHAKEHKNPTLIAKTKNESDKERLLWSDSGEDLAGDKKEKDSGKNTRKESSTKSKELSDAGNDKSNQELKDEKSLALKSNEKRESTDEINKNQESKHKKDKRNRQIQVIKDSSSSDTETIKNKPSEPNNEKPEKNNLESGTKPADMKQNKTHIDEKSTTKKPSPEENLTKTALKKKKKVRIGSLDSSPEDANDDHAKEHKNPTLIAESKNESDKERLSWSDSGEDLAGDKKEKDLGENTRKESPTKSKELSDAGKSNQELKDEKSLSSKSNEKRQSTDEINKNQASKHKKDKRNRQIQVIEDSSSSDTETTKNKPSEPNNEKPAKNNLESGTKPADMKQNKTHIDEKSTTKKPSPVKQNPISDIQSSDTESQKHQEKDTARSVHEKDKVSENDIQSKSDDQKEESIAKKADSPIEISEHDSGPEAGSITKPLLKCVDITKLLKEDVLELKNKVSDKHRKEMSTPESSSKSKSYKKGKYVSDSVGSDEEFWSKKRKEVLNFKAKKCVVNVCKLPPFSNGFLLENKINKITRSNQIVAEISTSKISKSPEKNKIPSSQDINDSNSTNRANKTNNYNEMADSGMKPEVTQAKSALLNDSDSDKVDKQACSSPTNVTEKIKNDLLNDSDSESDINGKSTKKRMKKTDDLDEPNYQESVKEKSDDVNNRDNIKSALLNDSSDEISNEQKNKEDTSGKDKSVSHKKIPIEDTATNDDHKETESASDDCGDKIKSSVMNDSLVDNSTVTSKITQPSNDQSTEKNKKINQNSENKEVGPGDRGDQIKSALLHDSSDDTCNLPNNKPDSAEKVILEGTEEPKETNKTGYALDESGNKEKSSDDTSKTSTPIIKKSSSLGSTPQSKRKHIMESMHAKKMLLTYSSSSDTEDELLRSALKEIKDSLLEGSDHEHSMNIMERMRVKRKLIDSSGSEEDIGKKNKKKAKKANNVLGKEVDSASTSQKEKNDKSSSSSRKMGRTKGKPNASSSQNSDTQDTDKDIDGLTNLKSLNKKSRRRDSSSTSKEEPQDPRRSKRKTDKMLVAPSISGDVMLEAQSTSSGAESAVEDVEDLPPVTVSSLNGGALDHLAKDDLLDESDGSSSQNKSSEELKNEEDSTEEDNVKTKRRKAVAISSDSESGATRKKKDPDTRLSDFEDSEAESSEPKNNKRKKKVEDSDASASDDGKKKRRRIKQVDDSEGSGSESETEGRKHGRKNIRKVMGKDQLEEATKKAAREEKERVARIAERQRMYNNMQFDESGKPDEVTLDKVILDFDPETKEPLIEVDRGLVKKLKPHQANGIKFMWDACFESVKRIKKGKGSGCILAHCMGLGKTLQVVSLTHTLLTHGDLTRVQRVLVVCPLSTVLNWVNEFTMWLKHAENNQEVDVYELSRYKQNSERAYQLQSWFNHGGVCVLGYEMFRNLSADNSKKYRKKMLQSFQQSLVDPGPDLVVCDEGHLLKNEKTSLSQSMNRVRTLRRIVLTGTPLQNNLKEYYCMVQFVKPNLLGKYNEYLNRFVNPITNGQYTDSTEHDIRIMKRRSHVLHKMLDGAVQRRDYGVLAPFLPPKHEYVLFITLTDIQTKLYQFYLDNYSRRPLPGKSSGFLFPDFQSLQRIWTHPLVLKYNSERYEIMQQKKRDKEEEEDSEGSLADFIDDESTPDESSTDESSDDLSDASDDSRKKKKKKSSKKSKEKGGKRRGTRANPVEQEAELNQSEEVEEVVKYENPTEWWIKLVADDELDDLKNSHKLVLLFEILRQCEAIGDKLLVFSQSLYSLDLIEHFLGKVDEATQEGKIDEKLGGHVGSWSPGIDYFRLDGSTSCENRSIWCKNFNREDNPRARLFLISTRAGGLGINLVAANRVIIFDVSWNPSHDVQSIFRVYRFGQKKPCYVYRFLAMGTMEEKIYERQVTKQAISKRVIDEQQIDRHYAENDLAELYKFEPCPAEPRALPPLPKDRLFAEMLKEHHQQIYKYHEHDSLLENKEEETLTEEERKAAWEDFENEKNRPPPAPFPNMWPNGMGANLMIQQQQQLAYAALAAMLRKDMPNMNENQLRDMLPLIYNANPGMFGGYDYGLMQKMGEIYKYAQPGMVNPMMNPMMNAATAGAGAGGTSGLQYSPPWQRQQEQQNQLRLQQLMQHQQQPMNAKYYAGGLGSRDPVAMALQHARARQMMAPETRPRGRPTLPPRPPADVVNLDSD